MGQMYEKFRLETKNFLKRVKKANRYNTAKNLGKEKKSTSNI